MHIFNVSLISCKVKRNYRHYVAYQVRRGLPFQFREPVISLPETWVFVCLLTR